MKTNTKGRIIGTDNQTVTTEAKNVIIFGSSGSGKTFRYVEPNVRNSIENGETVIVTDPTGQIHKSTAELAKANGYKVHILDFTNPAESDRWNPLDVYCETMDPYLLHELAIQSLMDSSGARPDPFFDQSEENLLKSLIAYVASPYYQGENRDLPAVYDMLQKIAINEGKCEEMNELIRKDPGNVIGMMWKVFAGSGRLRLNFTTGLALKLKSLQIEDMRKLLTSDPDGIHLNDLSEKKAIYIKYPIMNDFAMPFISIFLWEALKTYKESGEKAHIILDEFASLGRIHGLESFLEHDDNTAVSMIASDFWQLKKHYREVRPLVTASALLAFTTYDMDTAILFDNIYPERLLKAFAEHRDMVAFRWQGVTRSFDAYTPK